VFALCQVMLKHFYEAARSSTEDGFKAAWRLLIACVPRWAAEYLNTLLPIKDQWAHCYRVGVLTLGINSTQRVEGSIGKSKKTMGKKGTLMVSALYK